MAMNAVLSGMFASIVEEVERTRKAKQRHRKVVVDKSGKSVPLLQLTDATSTFHQNQYQNTSKGSVVGGVIGRDGGADIERSCFSDNVNSDAMFEHLANEQLVEGADRTAYRDYLHFRAPYDASLFKRPREGEQGRTRVEFLKRVYMSEALREQLASVAYDAQERILRLVLDLDLKALLYANVRSSEGRAVVDQFLLNRRNTFQSHLGEELEMKLEELGVASEFSDHDKCILTILHNTQRALGVGDAETYQAPENIKQLTIGKGIDRTRSAEFPHYATLVRTERVKVAARRAITLFSSGLSKITAALSDKYEPVGALKLLQAGTLTIYNLLGPDGSERQRCRQDGKEICDRFAPGKECAATAILMMYMELMDYMVNPSPPLMFRRDMRVQELYTDDEPYDEQNYDRWDSKKRKAFREAYMRFCARYLNVGFSFTEQRGPHGMQLLNLDSWGEGDIVVNPFRVREDAVLFKYFGAFRLQPNRLGIGSHARRVWLQHKIKKDFDPVYCNAFMKGAKGGAVEPLYFPRPVFDPNYFPLPTDDSNTPRFSHLYCNVPYDIANGPLRAAARREYFDSLTLDQWVKLDPRRFQNELAERIAPAPVWTTPRPDAAPAALSREASAMLNINNNFRNKPFDPNTPLADLQLSNKPQFQLTVPRYQDTQEGSTLSQAGLDYWRAVTGELRACYRAARAPVPLEALLPAPHLNDPLLHPVFNTRVSARKAWSDTGSQAFPYPLASLDGALDASVFPVGERTDRTKPYEQRPGALLEVFPYNPDPRVQVWDLRIPLVILLGDRASTQVQKCIAAMRNAASGDARQLNDLALRNLTTIPQNFVDRGSGPEPTPACPAAAPEAALELAPRVDARPAPRSPSRAAAQSPSGRARGSPSRTSSDKSAARGSPSRTSSDKSAARGSPSRTSSDKSAARGSPSRASSDKSTASPPRVSAAAKSPTSRPEPQPAASQPEPPPPADSPPADSPPADSPPVAPAPAASGGKKPRSNKSVVGPAAPGGKKPQAASKKPRPKKSVAGPTSSQSSSSATSLEPSMLSDASDEEPASDNKRPVRATTPQPASGTTSQDPAVRGPASASSGPVRGPAVEPFVPADVVAVDSPVMLSEDEEDDNIEPPVAASPVAADVAATPPRVDSPVMLSEDEDDDNIDIVG